MKQHTTYLGNHLIDIWCDSSENLYWVPFGQIPNEYLLTGSLLYTELYNFEDEVVVRLKVVQRLYKEWLN